jgi:hypothetical protein
MALPSTTPVADMRLTLRFDLIFGIAARLSVDYRDAAAA